MFDINYQKRKNIELFENLEKSELGFSNGQNYIPIYNRFFNLNDTNYNSINLNNKHYISNIYEQLDENIFECKLKNRIVKFSTKPPRISVGSIVLCLLTRTIWQSSQMFNQASRCNSKRTNHSTSIFVYL